MRRALRHWRPIAGLALCALGHAAPLAAHNETVESRPRPGEVLDAAPDHVEVLFEGPLSEGSFIQVMGEDFRRVDEGPTEILPPAEGGGMRVALADLAPGGYTAQWTAVDGLDGHTVRGSFAFSLRGPTGILGSARWQALGEWVSTNLHLLAGGWVIKVLVTLLVVRWLARRRAARKAALAAEALWEDDR